MVTLSDSEIATLISESKNIPSGLRPLTRPIQRNQYLRKEFEITGAAGSTFMIFTRQSLLNPFDFSAILGYKVPGFNTIFRLRRYNGKHTHTNAIERETIRDFHIHHATERYQKIGGMKEDSFAEVTHRYQTLDSAIDCLLEDCGFNTPLQELPLFTGQIQ
jgi:hypothetical protein